MNAKLSVLTVVVLACAGCGGGAAPGLDPSDPDSFKVGVEHPLFPIEPGTVWVYEGEHEGEAIYEEVHVLQEPRLIWGVPCTGIREERYADGVLVEVSTEWFAEDRAGNVWKFGEESIEFDGPEFARTPDSWIVGEGDAAPWMMISATPSVGERYYGYQPGGTDVMMVQSISATVIVPAGTFENCLKILENPEDVEDQDIILYAAGVGRVQEVSGSGQIGLVSIRSE